MESGEDVVRVNWQGSNRRTNLEIWDYVWSGDPAVGGDPLTNAGVGDGYTMPGGITNQTSIYSNVVAGATTGTEMESRVTWASLGFGGPANVSFHISSSNGTNIPTQIKDNMDGPSGGSLFPQDLVVTKTASETSQIGNQPFSYTVTVSNSAIIPFTNVVLSDVIPSITTYVSHVAEAGTTFDDTDANTIPDEWNIPSIPSNTTYTLTINVNAGIVPVNMTATNTATITASDQTDVDAFNDTDSYDVEITPVPVFTMVKSTSADPVTPGVPFTYSLLVTNTGGATGHSVSITDILSPFTILRMDTYGSSTPFLLTEGTPASGMTLTGATITYSDETSAPYVYDYVPATTGYDANVRSWKIDMTSTMNSSDGNFTITYDVNTN